MFSRIVVFWPFSPEFPPSLMPYTAPPPDKATLPLFYFSPNKTPKDQNPILHKGSRLAFPFCERPFPRGNGTLSRRRMPREAGRGTQRPVCHRHGTETAGKGDREKANASRAFWLQALRPSPPLAPKKIPYPPLPMGAAGLLVIALHHRTQGRGVKPWQRGRGDSPQGLQRAGHGRRQGEARRFTARLARLAGHGRRQGEARRFTARLARLAGHGRRQAGARSAPVWEASRTRGSHTRHRSPDRPGRTRKLGRPLQGGQLKIVPRNPKKRPKMAVEQC